MHWLSRYWSNFYACGVSVCDGGNKKWGFCLLPKISYMPAGRWCPQNNTSSWCRNILGSSRMHSCCPPLLLSSSQCRGEGGRWECCENLCVNIITLAARGVEKHLHLQINLIFARINMYGFILKNIWLTIPVDSQFKKYWPNLLGLYHLPQNN